MNKLLLPLPVALSVLAVGCGTEKTDVSEGVASLNSQVVEPQGAKLECPKEIEGGKDATFDCTVKATEGDKSQKVKLKVVEEEGELKVGFDDQAAFDKAVAEVGAQ
ncbi:MAG TPA: DUF4333 domain-containing protein [Solirubrobacteraceae bacterium]|nr:DUF4333 domain-containing protein [Solirubrobacteraceae bacterium]